MLCNKCLPFFCVCFQVTKGRQKKKSHISRNEVTGSFLKKIYSRREITNAK